jgi:pyruvate/2-oxoglutarate dehydrogenase complex dihydrolipoamide acyltransferase (E2) component
MTCHRYPLALVFVGVCALLIGACGGGNEPPPVTVSQPAAASAQPPAAQPPAAQPPAPAPAPGTPPPAESAPPSETASSPAASGTAGAVATAQPIAVEDHQEAGVQVALLDVRRTSGDTVTVRLQLRNTTDKAVSNPDFSSSNFVDAMYLIDGSSKKKYMVVRDAENKPVGYYGQSQTIPAKGTVSVWARFPTPASAKIMVSVPGAPPFEDVPIN